MTVTRSHCPTCGHVVNKKRLPGYVKPLDRRRGPTPKGKDERLDEMVTAYRDGKTLQQIGDKFGLTRERVRQIIRKVGVTGHDGGQFKRTTPKLVEKAISARKKADAKSWHVYGCDKETLLKLNLGMRTSKRESPVVRFFEQRRNAVARGISWDMTFFQWASIWAASGKWHLRGRGAGKFCMARKGDTGGYSCGNVYITTIDGNVRDYQASLKERGVVASDGYKRLPENSVFESAA